MAGWVLVVCSMVSRPCSCQTSAKSFRKPCENAVRLSNRSAVQVARDAGGPHPAVHMFGRLKRHSFCFLLLITREGTLLIVGVREVSLHRKTKA